MPTDNADDVRFRKKRALRRRDIPNVAREVALVVEPHHDAHIAGAVLQAQQRVLQIAAALFFAADAALAGPNIAVEQCDLAGIAAGAADAVRPLAEANQQQVNRHLEPAIIDGDPTRLAQIVTNLLTNAIKFAPPGGTIELVVQRNSVQRTATLTVSDNGPGIPAEDRPHVFERFYRGASARPVAGSGIGLAVVAQLVKAHGGSVGLVDTLTGTTIAATFPTA